MYKSPISAFAATYLLALFILAPFFSYAMDNQGDSIFNLSSQDSISDETEEPENTILASDEQLQSRKRLREGEDLPLAKRQRTGNKEHINELLDEGDYYCNNFSIPDNFKKASYCFEKAIKENNSAWAHYQLGYIFSFGPAMAEIFKCKFILKETRKQYDKMGPYCPNLWDILDKYNKKLKNIRKKNLEDLSGLGFDNFMADMTKEIKESIEDDLENAESDGESSYIFTDRNKPDPFEITDVLYFDYDPFSWYKSFPQVGLKENFPKAMEHFKNAIEQAVKQGNLYDQAILAYAYYYLGILHEINSKESPNNQAKAFEYYSHALNNGLLKAGNRINMLSNKDAPSPIWGFKDVLADIFRSLSFKNFLSFRCVCKAFTKFSMPDLELPISARRYSYSIILSTYPNIDKIPYQIHDAMTDAMVVQFTNLTALTVVDSVYGFQDTIHGETLARLTNLTSLNPRNRLTNQTLLPLTNLTHLVLPYNSVITNEGLLPLIKLRSLVLFENHMITDEAVLRLTNLTHLELGNSNISDGALSQLFMLTSLDISRGSQVTGAALRKLTNLRKLNLFCNAKITNEDIIPLTGLTSLILGYNDAITGEVFKAFLNLRCLHLGGNEIISDDAICLLTNLSELDLNHNTTITDNGLKSLTNLTKLNLTNSAITDGSLNFLTNLTDLELGNNDSCIDSTITLDGIKPLVKLSKNNIKKLRKTIKFNMRKIGDEVHSDSASESE